MAMLDATESLAGAADLRERSYKLLGDCAGKPVIDVGCGTGTAVSELASRGADAFGIDADAQMILEARRRHPQLRFETGDACRLPLPDCSLAGYRADKVLHEVANPAAAVAEARRVLAPRGTAVLIGQDWDGMLIDAEDVALTRTILTASTASMPSPAAARSYRAMLLDSGFSGVEATGVIAVLTSEVGLAMVQARLAAAVANGLAADDAAAWEAEQTQRAETDRLLVALPLLLVSGRRV